MAVVAVIATAPAVVIIAIWLSHIPQGVRDGTAWRDFVSITLVLLVPLSTGIALTAWRWRWRREFIPALETLLVTGYVAVATMCLFAFRGGPDLGYWLTVPATASFAADMLLPSARPNL